MSNDITLVLDDEAATLACGKKFASILVSGLIVYLHGDLGAGKTTFVRGVLHGLGHVGKVKSPLTHWLNLILFLAIMCIILIYIVL
jgi:tRNA threonylcarbamoyladenosine biosynthesis protein TsaE